MHENLPFCVKKYEHYPPSAIFTAKILVPMLRTFLIFSLLISSLYGHGDMHSVIKTKDEEIAKDTQNARLYLERALLYEQHGAADEAVKDFDTAEKLNPELTDFDFLKGRILLADDKFAEALKSLNKSLLKEAGKENFKAYVLRGRTLYNLKKYDEAAKDFNKAVELSDDLRPGLVLEQMHAHLRSTGSNRKTALQFLDHGLQKIGPSIALLSEKILILEEEKDYAAAAEETGKVMEMVNRKEIWLIRRAGYLIKAGKADDAEKDLQECLAVIKKLPEVVRNRKINKRMLQKAEELLKSIR